MITLTPAQLELLATVQVRRYRRDDPAAMARRARHTAGFAHSVKAGLRYSRSTPISCR